MADPFLSEIRVFSFVFAPRGWAQCNGQLLPINQNQALFSLLGTTYGGDGRVNFALPDLRGRVPTHRGTMTLGQRGGEEAHTLTQQELPQHDHALPAVATAATIGAPGPLSAAALSEKDVFVSALQSPVTSGTTLPAGGSQPHANSMPSMVLNFCIALQGIFPSPT